MTAPIKVRVTRHKCPHCGRTRASRTRAVDHMARCWYNPAAEGCKTCRFFATADFDDYGDDCDAGVDLSGRPACTTCKGRGEVFGDDYDASECPTCGGDGAEVKPGPITGCSEWAPRVLNNSSQALPTERS